MKCIKFEEFPPLLREIPDPPQKLYLRGNLIEGDFKMLCIVGTRQPTEYGMEVCEKLISGLARHPIIIVSGLAHGVDSLAHRNAIKYKLKTIAVPGSGLDNAFIYPQTHKGLAENILDQGGALISEFEPKTPGYPGNFPQRNRIMAGMSHATLIIEARAKSGTMITARLATDYNRDVMTVPGSIFSPMSEGPHRLLRLGAAPIRSSADILDILGFGTEADSTASASQPLPFDPHKYDDCSEEELVIIRLLSSPRTKEELYENLSETFPTSQINILISLLEIKGLITESLSKFHLT
jgi:DNA processing protein